MGSTSNVTTFPKVLTPLPPDEITTSTLKNPNMWGADKYWTFVVSAHDSDFPVPVYSPGLPPFLVTYHKAHEVACQTLGTKSIRLYKYYSLGHRGEYFNFISDAGKTTIINAHTLRSEQPEKVLLRDAPLGKPKPNESPSAQERTVIDAYTTQVAEEWERIRTFHNQKTREE